MKHPFRRTSVYLLLLLLLFSVFPLTAAAESQADTENLRSVGELSPLEETIYLGLMRCDTRISLDGHNASVREVDAALQHLRNSAAELFHIGTGYSYTHIGGTVTALTPQYTMTGAELTAARARYRLALDEIAASVSPAWSDAEICLYLHDYLCLAFSYDTTYTVYDAYGFLVGGSGVCQSYTLVYSALLARFDIPVTYAEGTSDGELHIWNIVTLGDKSYHVDVTWGDPTASANRDFGIAKHKSFLKSDAAIDAAGHEDRVNHGGIICDDTTYDDILLTGIDLATVFVGEDAYATNGKEIFRLSDDLCESECIYTVDAAWVTAGGGIYVDRFSGLGSDLRSALFVNTPSAILELDPLSGTVTELAKSPQGQIFRLYSLDGTLYYLTADHLTLANAAFVNAAAYTYTLPPAIPACTGEHELCEYTRVDAYCAAEGAVYYVCTVCGHKEMTVLSSPPHDYVSTVVAPGYGTAGYTRHVCDVCGDTVTDTPTDALPLPTNADFAAAVDAVRDAESAEEFLTALIAATEMRPYLDPDGIADETARLEDLIAAYDARTEAINADFGQSLENLLRMDSGLYTPSLTLLGVLILVIRMRFGL